VRGKRWGWSESASQAESEELICEDECAASFVKEISQLVNPANGSVKVATSAEGLLIMQIIDDIYSMMNDSTN
jgi:hypothetical protein